MRGDAFRERARCAGPPPSCALALSEPDPISGAHSRAEEALLLLKTLKVLPADVRAESNGSTVFGASGISLAWCPAAYYFDVKSAESVSVDASDAEANARFFVAAPRLIEQLAADVIALAERGGR